MTNDKKKFQKKKDREKVVKKKVLHRREKIRADAKEQERWNREDAKNSPKGKPLSSAEERRQRALREAEVRLQLQRNIDMLKALEEKYDQDRDRIIEPNTITVVKEEKPAE